MSEEKKKEKKDKLSIVLDIFFLTIITVGLGFFAIQTEIFWYVSRFLVSLIEYVCLIIPLWLVFILVLGLIISGIVLIVKKWKILKNIHVKIFIIWVVIVMSALVIFALIGLVVLDSIRDAFH
ncbi:MAG: hypothetical protein AMJ75_03445 [Phycisphaerae bacterium SM1_79]|nr:MAG: hypothetical protein AMJ75_03445 [Phycisphaerae bacterium SM1_79]